MPTVVIGDISVTVEEMMMMIYAIFACEPVCIAVARYSHLPNGEQCNQIIMFQADVNDIRWRLDGANGDWEREKFRTRT